MERSLSLVRSSKRHMLMATIYISNIGAVFLPSQLPLLHFKKLKHTTQLRTKQRSTRNGTLGFRRALHRSNIPCLPTYFHFQFFEFAGARLCSGAARIASAAGGTTGDAVTCDVFMPLDFGFFLLRTRRLSCRCVFQVTARSRFLS